MTDPEIRALIARFEARLDAQDRKVETYLQLSALADERSRGPVSAPVPAEPEPEYGRVIHVEFPQVAS
jgi:predicted component of type VI protein secretion system